MKTLAFVTCSNGYGHFKRILEVAKGLVADYGITIFCEPYQLSKFNPTLDVTFIHPPYQNIRWDKLVATGKEDYKSYIRWLDWIGPHLLRYDIVVSDNILGVLKYRPDTIIMGSFFWHDVIKEKLGSSKISKVEEELLNLHNPAILTNKYVEIGSVREYKNKIQTGFGFKEHNNYAKITPDFITAVRPSLDYSKGYTEFFNSITQQLGNSFRISNNIEEKGSSLFIIRPGVGIITHCVENKIPMLCLYDTADSIEIIQLALRVEEMGFGLSHNISQPLLPEIVQAAKVKDIYIKDVEKDGYSYKASYLKSL